MKNFQNSEKFSAEENSFTYQFISNLALSSYFQKDYLSLSKEEERSIFSFHQLFTEYKMAVLEICPELISETVAQLAKEIEKKENAVERSDDLNEYDACSKFSENLRMYRFIATSALADYFLMNHPFDM
jgi:hypothetical protein